MFRFVACGLAVASVAHGSTTTKAPAAQQCASTKYFKETAGNCDEGYYADPCPEGFARKGFYDAGNAAKCMQGYDEVANAKIPGCVCKATTTKATTTKAPTQAPKTEAPVTPAPTKAPTKAPTSAPSTPAPTTTKKPGSSSSGASKPGSSSGGSTSSGARRLSQLVRRRSLRKRGNRSRAVADMANPRQLGTHTRNELCNCVKTSEVKSVVVSQRSEFSFGMDSADLAKLKQVTGAAVALAGGICFTFHKAACDQVKDMWKDKNDLATCFAGDMKSVNDVTVQTSLKCTPSAEITNENISTSNYPDKNTWRRLAIKQLENAADFETTYTVPPNLSASETAAAAKAATVAATTQKGNLTGVAGTVPALLTPAEFGKNVKNAVTKANVQLPAALQASLTSAMLGGTAKVSAPTTKTGTATKAPAAAAAAPASSAAAVGISSGIAVAMATLLF